MKNIAFAVLVFGIPFLFPIYLVVELRRGVAETKKHTITDGVFEAASVPVLLFSQKQTEISFPFYNYPDKTDAMNKTDVVKRIANTGHKHFNN